MLEQLSNPALDGRPSFTDRVMLAAELDDQGTSLEPCTMPLALLSLTTTDGRTVVANPAHISHIIERAENPAKQRPAHTVLVMSNGAEIATSIPAAEFRDAIIAAANSPTPPPADQQQQPAPLAAGATGKPVRARK